MIVSCCIGLLYWIYVHLVVMVIALFLLRWMLFVWLVAGVCCDALVVWLDVCVGFGFGWLICLSWSCLFCCVWVWFLLVYCFVW